MSNTISIAKKRGRPKSDITKTEMEILKAIKTVETHGTEIAEIAKISKKGIYTHLNRLVDKGYIVGNEIFIGFGKTLFKRVTYSLKEGIILPEEKSGY